MYPADHMSLLTERRIWVRLRAINMLLLRSKDGSANYVIALETVSIAEARKTVETFSTNPIPDTG